MRLDGLSGVENTGNEKLLVENVLRQSGLNDVGSIWEERTERTRQIRSQVSGSSGRQRQRGRSKESLPRESMPESCADANQIRSVREKLQGRGKKEKEESDEQFVRTTDF